MSLSREQPCYYLPDDNECKIAYYPDYHQEEIQLINRVLQDQMHEISALLYQRKEHP